MDFYKIDDFYEKLFSMRKNKILVQMEEFLDDINERQAFYDICVGFATLSIKYRNKNDLLINFRSECVSLIRMIKGILLNHTYIDVKEFYNAIAWGVSTLVIFNSDEEGQLEQNKFEKHYVVLFSIDSDGSEIQKYIIDSITPKTLD